MIRNVLLTGKTPLPQFPALQLELEQLAVAL